jgi:hypothetical protein
MVGSLAPKTHGKERIPKAKNKDTPDGFLWVKHELKSSHINQVSRTE